MGSTRSMAVWLVALCVAPAAFAQNILLVVGDDTRLAEGVQRKVQPIGGLVDGPVVFQDLAGPRSVGDVTRKIARTVTGLQGLLEIFSKDPHSSQVHMAQNLVMDVAGRQTSTTGLT